MWPPSPGLLALTVGSFGIGVTEFVIMGLLLEVGADMQVSVSAAGLLITGYALGVVVGAPLLTVFLDRFPRKYALLALMGIFSLGNLACALSPTYGLLMTSRVITALAHGSYFGIGSVVAASLVAPERRASAIALMFTGLTAANILGVPFGTWLGQVFGWRSTFFVVTLIGISSFLIIARFVSHVKMQEETGSIAHDLSLVAQPKVILALTTTVLGYAGVFATFTYIAPILTNITGFGEDAISPILILFGAGLVIGNFLGGWFADRNAGVTVYGSLAILALVSLLLGHWLAEKQATLVLVALFGAAAFSTVAPLQTWIIGKAEGAGQSLISSFNIAGFNLGNAIGAVTGGLVLDHGPGLAAIPFIAAAFPVLALATAAFSNRAERDPEILLMNRERISDVEQ